MGLPWATGGGGNHLKLSAALRDFFSDYIPTSFAGCGRVVYTNKNNTVMHNRCAMQRGTIVTPPTSRDCYSSSLLCVTMWLFLICRRLRTFNGAPGCARVNPRYFAVLLSAALLTVTPAVYAPDFHFFSRYTASLVTRLSGNTVAPPFLLVSAAQKSSAVLGNDNKFPTRNSGQYISSTSLPGKGSPGEEPCSLSGTENRRLGLLNTWHRSGRRLAASTPGASKTGASKPGASKPGQAQLGPFKPGASNPGASKPGASCPGAPHPGVSIPGAPNAGAPNPGAPKARAFKPGASTSRASYPGESYPGASYFGVSNPGASKPGESKPEVSQPGTTNPKASSPGTSNPGASNPEASNPGASNPGASNPGLSKPGTSKPGAPKAGPSKSGAPNPGASNPEPSNPGAFYPGASYPGASTSRASNTGASKPGTLNPRASDSGASNSGVSNSGASKPVASSPGASNPGSSDETTPKKQILLRTVSIDMPPEPPREADVVDAAPLMNSAAAGEAHGASELKTTDGDMSPPCTRARRCYSFSHMPPQLQDDPSFESYPPPFRGHSHPQRTRQSPLSWEEGGSPTSLLSSTPESPDHLSGQAVPSNVATQFNALFRGKPYSVAETLWNRVSATERSAFAEMGEKKSNSTPGKKSNGGSVSPRLDSRGPAAGEDSSAQKRQSTGGKKTDTLDVTGSGSDSTLSCGSKRDGVKRRSESPTDPAMRRRGSRKRMPLEGLFVRLYKPQSESSDPATSRNHKETKEGTEGLRASPSPLAPPAFVTNVVRSSQASANPSFGEQTADNYEDTLGRSSEEPDISDDTEGDTFPPDYSADSEDSEDSVIPPLPGGRVDGDDRLPGRHSRQSSEDFRVLTPDAEGGGADPEKRPPDFIKLMFGTYYMYLQQDVRLRRQFALLVLSSIEWPMYTQSRKWHRPQLGKWFAQLLQLVSETLSLEGGSLFGNILREQITELGWILRSVEDFERFLRGQSKVDLHLRFMLMYVPGHRLAINLKPELLLEVYNEVTSLQLIYYYLSGLHNPQATSLLRWNFIQEVHLRWSMLQLLGISHQLITLKPLTGVLILQVDKIDTQEEQVLQLFHREENKTAQEALMRFETTVTNAITMRIQMVAKHFKKIFSTTDSQYKREFQLPKCQVTAFYLKPEGSETEKLPDELSSSAETTPPNAENSSPRASEAIETGLFGFEIDVNIAKNLKDRLPRGSMYIQLSLVDPWDYVPEYKPLSDDPSIIPAYRATQILKANLEHDPSLVRVGITKVIYTTVVDAYNSPTQNQKGYDSDRHLVFRVPMSEFKSEEAFLADVVGMVSVPSMHNAAPGTLNPHRIKVIGSARRLSQGELIKTGNFLNGIDYRRHKSIETMVESNTVAVHVFLEGLKDKNTSPVFELPASTIFDRVVRRGRSKFTIMHAEVVPKKSSTGGPGRMLGQRAGGYPAWVLVVSNLCVAVFFSIVLVSLLLNRHAKLPWWIACICGPQNPFASESEARQDYVAEHAESASAFSKKRAMFFARSRSMLVPALGTRKYDWGKYDPEQQTKSTVDEPDTLESGSENRPPAGWSRNSAIHGCQRRSIGSTVVPLSVKGSVYFGGRSIQQRQEAGPLINMPADDGEPFNDKLTATNTVPILSTVPADSTDIILNTDTGALKHRSRSAGTEDITSRDTRAATTVTYQAEKSLPSQGKIPHARSGLAQGMVSPRSSPNPLRTLELAQSYRRERRPHPVPAHTPQQYVHVSRRRNSFSHKRISAGKSGVRHRNEASGPHVKVKWKQDRKPSLHASHNTGRSDVAPHAPTGVSNIRNVHLDVPSGAAVDDRCGPSLAGNLHGPAGMS